MPAPIRPGVRIAQSAGLTVFLATGILLGGLTVMRVAAGLGSLQAVAVALSTLAGAVACFAMLGDAVDLWMRSQRMTPYSQKMVHSLVFVTVLAALGLSMIGRNSLILLYLAPSLVIYFLIVRQVLAGGASPRRATQARTAGGRQGGAARSRQRRGGRKNR